MIPLYGMPFVMLPFKGAACALEKRAEDENSKYPVSQGCDFLSEAGIRLLLKEGYTIGQEVLWQYKRCLDVKLQFKMMKTKKRRKKSQKPKPSF